MHRAMWDAAYAGDCSLISLCNASSHFTFLLLSCFLCPAPSLLPSLPLSPPAALGQIWSTQPRVWEGLILLPKYIGTRELTEKMNEALFTLPTSLLQDLLKKNPDIRPILAAYATRSRKNVGLDVAKRKVLGL